MVLPRAAERAGHATAAHDRAARLRAGEPKSPYSTAAPIGIWRFNHRFGENGDALTAAVMAFLKARVA
ncbi:hypothetical protein EOA60_07095 [Mesorhizobium sp. M1A.F.Ca.IN.020.06.1.1]|uniref:hypothetical protein n=1 Tax=unclassified Mesorhizobium TaxID=325217 RepID=UPI000BAFB625|nr:MULTISPECIES: hypothetical protein [unclassified Mesorhizobium]PBB34081.1 hypothetical protein CK214_07000 [Mesorhizobium sp. WSM3882]RUV05660.1 hypothetical protein EOA79_12020 [Mesorhizobium sp. M1A.F.Ca.IN.020.03.2.1]RUV84856.1 hypothetical protein EOA51_20390 [Mesorhizobium sp. M1A.F.Ca.IN.020.32.1.1]RUW11837.1 hypothetical protein EOA46_11155 [Mesorhizobium sp. M1A.F.Ca.IN.022.05.2.1]RUW33815.1 hypothetical protein EOA60_07095 [Mesorhizobium sp. M1A.F.Ca.IN.020.06.1.1]